MDDAVRTLAGRYELAGVIGRGGMGTVYEARDLVLGRSVAVKLLAGLLADQDPTSIARFEREARAAAALNHPAVVAVYDTGEDDGARFIVMELISGRSLEAILREQGPLEPARAAEIAARVADALAAAHAAGIVHRDVKPANVMIADDGSVKVLDFGIARAIDGTTLTQNAMVLGTAAYMSPEQALGKPADERSDIYALGCVLYALITGRPPFTGDSPAVVLNQHANLAPPPLGPEVSCGSPGLAALVIQMLAKSPDDRPQTAAQVRDRLTSAPARPQGTPAATAATKRLAPTTARRQLPSTAKPGRRRLILAVGLAVLLLVIAVVALAFGGGSPRTTSNARHDTKAPKAKTPTTRSRTTTGSTTTTATKPATPTPTQTSSTATTASTPAPQTVSGAAGALTALTTQEAQSGTIDQHAAKQITGAMSDILNSYDMGHTNDVPHKLGDLSQHVAMLEQHGDITSKAAPGINQAVATFSKALASAPVPTIQTPGAKPSKPGQPAHPRKRKSTPAPITTSSHPEPDRVPRRPGL
jgi:eukaryotic-like serine/threonine-protein kinase